MAFFAHREKENTVRALPRGVSLRPGTLADEVATFAVMGRAMGYEMQWSHHAAMRHHLRSAAQVSFWVAEETPRFGSAKIVGYARSITRGDVWNLTEFFVLPECHRRGIGGALLARCLEEGVRQGAEARFVLASHSAAADSLYIRRAGCFPRLPMLLLSGATANLHAAGRFERAPVLERYPSPAMPLAEEPPTLALLESLPEKAGSGKVDIVEGTLYAEPLVLTAESKPALTRLDQAIVGYSRLPEHQFWAGDMGGAGGASRLFRRPARDGGAGGEIVGYAYMGTHASGPALAQNPADLPRMTAHVAALLHAAIHKLSALDRTPASEHYLAVPGSNEVMLSWLLECGWQIVFQYLFMSSRPMGQLDRYICHNPLYTL